MRAEYAADWMMGLLGATALIAAAAAFMSPAISSFLRIFAGIFLIETIVFGLTLLRMQSDCGRRATRNTSSRLRCR